MAGVQRITINYASGTGNDVVLKRDPPATIVWDGGPTGQGTDWSVPVNWAGDLMPINGDSAIIGPLAGPPVVLSLGGSPEPLNKVTVEGATLRLVGGFLMAGLINSGTVELTSSGSSPTRLWGSITNAVGGVITTLAGSAGTQSFQGPIDNQGTFTIGTATTWSNRGASVNSGTINIAGGDLTLDQSVSGASFSTAGAVTVAASRTITVSGGAFTQTGGTTTVAGTLLVNGAYTQTGGTTMVGGTLTVNGAFGQSGGTVAAALNGPIPGIQYGQIKVNGTVALGGSPTANFIFAPALGDTFRIIDNDGTDPVVGTFAGLPEGATFAAGGLDFRVSYVGGTGNDVTLTRVGPMPLAPVTQVNDSAAQRSRVTSLAVSFTTPVTFAGPMADAFLLRRDGDGAAVGFTATADVVGGVTVVTLTGFTGVATEFGSLADGSYTLTALAARISTPAGPLDGNGDGVGGDDYTFGSAQGLFRRYGDATGDGRVDAADLAMFRQTFGRIVGDPLYLSWLDVNGDGAINGTDLTRFRLAYGAGG